MFAVGSPHNFMKLLHKSEIANTIMSKTDNAKSLLDSHSQIASQSSKKKLSDAELLLHYIAVRLISLNQKREEERKRGELFNIFSICRIGADEERLHSNLIAELLRPNGSHGMGNAFAKLFLEHLSLEELDFNLDSYKVDTESVIDDGRVDVLLRDSSGRCIVIENKIYAGDQPAQLERYHRHFSKSGHVFKLLYLTLDGREPSNESKGTLKEDDYICLSYMEDVKRWIEGCLKESYDKPLVRETLKQYLTIIQKLTSTIMDSEDKKKMIELLSEENNLETTLAIASLRDDVIRNLWDNVFIPQIKTKIESTRYGIISKGELFKSYDGITFSVDGWNNFNIRLQFQSQGCCAPIYGLVYRGGVEKSKAVGGEADSTLRAITSFEHNQWWPIYKPCDKYDDMRHVETLKAIYSGEFTDYVFDRLEELYNLCKDIVGM